MHDQEKLMLDIDESARMVGLGRSKWLAELYAGRCVSVKVGRRRLIPRQALLDYIEKLRQEAREEIGA